MIKSSPSDSAAVTKASPSSDNQFADYQQVKGIIFDIDGTLADSWKLGFDATVSVLEKHGIPTITQECYHEHCIYCTPERLARHAGLVPGAPDFDTVGAALGKEFDDMYVQLVDTTTAGFYPGMHPILKNVPSHVALGALTNACVAYAHAVLQANNNAQEEDDAGLYSRFGSIHGADSVPTPKPSPDGLLQVCQDLGLKPEECVYIGDSPSDAGAAAAAGMPSIGVLWGSNGEEKLRKAPFSHIIQTVEELETLLPKQR
jgi:phosphoglycolate phosphatase-like HAD superfamily hydrolase